MFAANYAHLPQAPLKKTKGTNAAYYVKEI